MQLEDYKDQQTREQIHGEVNFKWRVESRIQSDESICRYTELQREQL